MRAKFRYVGHSGTLNIYERHFHRRNANSFFNTIRHSRFINEKIIAASFLYVSKNAGNEPSCGKAV